MGSLSLNRKAALKSLFTMCLTLLLTPNIVAFVSLCFFSRVATTTALKSLTNFGVSLEMVAAALLAIGIGMTVYLVIAALSAKRPTLADMIAIELSQAFAFFLSIAALVHNPQEEFCKAGPVGSALADAFHLDSCSLTVNFWKQTAMGGFVVAVFLLLCLYFGRAFVRSVSQEKQG